jgi:PAS domain S-box-containing protein
VTTVTLCTLVLAALFAERRRNEAALKLALLAEGETKSRLADAMVAGQVMAFEWNAITGITQRDNAIQILGFEPSGKVTSPSSDFIKQVHADDRERFEACVRELRPNSPSFALTFRLVRPDGRTVWLEENAKGEFDVTGRLLRIKGLARDVTERKELEEHKNLLIGELDHRAKNLLSTVLVIVSHARATSSSMAEFAIALDGRIRSLARTHELLSARSWKGLRLSELVHRELAPFATANNTRIEGSDEILTAEAGQVIAMVLHELATNAAKYGALSGKYGHVSVRWSRVKNGETEKILCIHWEENGGPIIFPPTRTGYGTIVIRDLISYELGGTVDLVHARDGVRCKIEVPAHWLIGRLAVG